MSFRPGDKVKCVDSSHSYGALQYAKVYEVSLDDDGLLYLRGVPEGWAAFRFELVKESKCHM